MEWLCGPNLSVRIRTQTRWHMAYSDTCGTVPTQPFLPRHALQHSVPYRPPLSCPNMFCSLLRLDLFKNNRLLIFLIPKCFPIAVAPRNRHAWTALFVLFKPSRNRPGFFIGDVTIRCRFPINGTYVISSSKFKNGLHFSRPLVSLTQIWKRLND